MPEHIYSIACRSHSIDSQSNGISLFFVLEEVIAPGFPAALPSISFITYWRRRDEEAGSSFVQRTRILNPVGEERACFQTSFRLDRPRHRVIATIDMVPFDRIGTFQFEVALRADDSSEWVIYNTYPFDVRIVPERADAELPFHAG